jgi:hypothetical protein
MLSAAAEVLSGDEVLFDIILIACISGLLRRIHDAASLQHEAAPSDLRHPARTAMLSAFLTGDS